MCGEMRKLHEGSLAAPEPLAQQGDRSLARPLESELAADTTSVRSAGIGYLPASSSHSPSGRHVTSPGAVGPMSRQPSSAPHQDRFPPAFLAPVRTLSIPSLA